MQKAQGQKEPARINVNFLALLKNVVDVTGEIPFYAAVAKLEEFSNKGKIVENDTHLDSHLDTLFSPVSSVCHIFKTRQMVDWETKKGYYQIAHEIYTSSILSKLIPFIDAKVNNAVLDFDAQIAENERNKDFHKDIKIPLRTLLLSIYH